MNLESVSIQELKALAYDELAQLEQAQLRLRLITEQIQKKSEEKKIHDTK